MLRTFKRKKILNRSELATGEIAGKLFDAGDNCAQAVLQATNPEVTSDLVKMAAVFGGGIGNSKCLCGAVAGGVMALGLQGKGDRSGEVISGFRERNRTTCCKALSAPFTWLSNEHTGNCRRLTVETAEHIARILND